ncbi:C40 family peptidase [Streptomyces sp. ISL-36]|uniref:C40 family peptidase n=1 Tax=Streptomyces sp. ISL-36 TaxID=2819182 RepID=UPI001BE8B3C6|nr:C40 family peptidase [Streptomyces sp. ISL-36]MBT2440806.1 C40 family peptidase [Streptomyces sp. ISL-36]
MPVLASHRKPRSTRPHSPAVGVTTAALASVTLLSTQSAHAAPAAPPRPTVEEVQKKVDALYRQAGTATQEYNRAKEATDEQRRKVDRILDDVARRTDAINESRRALGSYAAAQYRAGAVGPTAALIFADSPQSYFDQTHLMDRLSERQRGAVADYEGKRLAAAKQRAEATKSLESLTDAQATLRTSKQTVQRKLAEARTLLARLTAEEKARLAELEREREAEARRKAEERAKAEAAQAEAERRRQEEEARRQPSAPPVTPPTAPPQTGGSTYAAKVEKALAFARAQIGKPYVWGATGPSSYDCSGLTQAAWKAAGVDLPRTTWDQVEVGTRVATADLLPGDLVFFYDDISHVGLYIGGGKMIHAPKPGAEVREESIYYMPIYGSVRPT